jgi:hypothetical protein
MVLNPRNLVAAGAADGRLLNAVSRFRTEQDAMTGDSSLKEIDAYYERAHSIPGKAAAPPMLMAADALAALDLATEIGEFGTHSIFNEEVKALMNSVRA